MEKNFVEKQEKALKMQLEMEVILKARFFK
jgi:hypothetical protein